MEFDTYKKMIAPKQPYFVLGSSNYYKAELMTQGISHFYSFYYDGALDSRISAVPDGCIDMLFCCDQQHPYGAVCGTVLKPTLITMKKNSYYFGVRFLPGHNFRFKDAKMSDFIEHQIDISDLLSDQRLLEGIASHHDFGQQIDVFMSYYLENKQMYEADLQENVLRDFLLKTIIEHKGKIKVRTLAEASGYSERYVNKVFNNELGMSPKAFSKLMRFQYLLNHMNDYSGVLSELNLSELAIDLGYYDQSHMIKDFHELSNITPTKYLHLLEDTGYKKRIILV